MLQKLFLLNWTRSKGSDARNSLISDGMATGRYSFHSPVQGRDMISQVLTHDVVPCDKNRVTVAGGKVYEKRKR